jgi:mannonate dehydratase
VLCHLERSGRSGGRRDVLLAGPRQRQQLEHLQQIIRDAGRAGIPVLGYDFSLAGVAGRVKGRFARADV